jgi:putative inorganic carbon (HCO3(-)) transporter
LVAALTIDLIASAESRLRWAVMAVIMAGVGQALIGLYEFFGGSGANHLAILDGRHYRAFGSFGQPNPFAGFVGICLMLGLGITWGALTDTLTSRASILSGETVVKRAKGARSVSALWQTVVYAVLTALLGAALLASWSRGAWMGVAAAGVVMALFLPRRLRTGLLVVGVLVALVVGLWASGRLPTAIVERVMGGLTRDLSPLSAGAPASVADVRGVDIGDANYAEIERLAHWQAAVNMALAHPWLGVGFGNYAAAYPAYALMNWPEPLGHAHNYLLNLLAETGLIGLAAYIVLWVAILGLTLRALGRSKGYRRGLALGLLGVWTHLIIHNLVDKLYVNNVFLHVGVLLGVLAVLLADESTVSSQVISTQGRRA